MGGGAGALSSVPMLAEASGSGSIGKTLEFLASPYGAAVVGGSVNATSQYVQTGTINPVNVAVSSATAALGMRGGFWWNVGLNAEGGVVQTEANNLIYGGNDSVLLNGALSGGSAAGGYGAGYIASSVSSAAMRPNLNSVPEWVLMPGTPSILKSTNMQGARLFTENPIPVISGNAASSIVTEVAGTAESWQVQSQEKAKKMDKK